MRKNRNRKAIVKLNEGSLTKGKIQNIIELSDMAALGFQLPPGCILWDVSDKQASIDDDFDDGIVSGNYDDTSETIGIPTVTESRSFNIEDTDEIVCVNSANAVSLTVPTNENTYFQIGTEIEVCQLGTGAVNIVAAEGVTVLSMGGSLSIAEQYGCVALKKIGINTWLLAGALG